MPTGTETLHATAEKFTAATSQSFKDTVEKSLTAMNELNAQSKHNLEAMVASATAASKGAEALGSQVIAFAKKTMEDNVAAARSLSSARSVQEAVELQTTWAKSAMEAYLAEVTKASETVAASVKETITPINARVTAAVEKFQAAR